MNGVGCPKCGTEKARKNISSNTEEFIKDANRKHGEKYDYSQVTYIHGRKKVKINCFIHGPFSQIPANHLSGAGCPVCGIEKRAKERTRIKAESFVERSVKIHGNEFDYSKVEYKHARIPVIIICNKHGEFKQTPNKHLNGQGCPHCKESNGEKEMCSFLKEKGIKFDAQKRFSWLKSQSIDFYIPELRIAIEVQGVQHFKPTDFNGGGEFLSEVAYIKCTGNDMKKFQLCNDHGIEIIYYSDDETNKMTDGKTFHDKETLLSYIKKINSWSKQRQIEA